MDKLNVNEFFELKRARLTKGELRISDLRGIAQEIEAFKFIAQNSSAVPVEIVHVKCGEIDALPVSRLGKTSVRYVGTSPMISLELDANNNLEMMFPGTGAVEVFFNSETPQAHGKNHGAHGKKKIYIVSE